MKHQLLLAVILLIASVSCKKEQTATPAPPITTTSTPHPLPARYIILHDGADTDTLSVWSNHWQLTSSYASNTYMCHAIGLPQNESIDLIVRLPTDSIAIQNFTLATYGTGKRDTGSDDQFDADYYNVLAGTLGFRRVYSSGAYTSVANSSTTTYFNTITSITHLKTQYDNLSSNMSEFFIIEGHFSIQCKFSNSSVTKDYTGSYKFEVPSWQF